MNLNWINETKQRRFKSFISMNGNQIHSKIYIKQIQIVIQAYIFFRNMKYKTILAKVLHSSTFKTPLASLQETHLIDIPSGHMKYIQAKKTTRIGLFGLMPKREPLFRHTGLLGASFQKLGRYPISKNTPKKHISNTIWFSLLNIIFTFEKSNERNESFIEYFDLSFVRNPQYLKSIRDYIETSKFLIKRRNSTMNGCDPTMAAIMSVLVRAGT